MSLATPGDDAGRAYPRRVDVAIVGSGPAGAAYARILSESAPQATIAVFEAGPLVSDPPGAHVKNIENAALRAEAQRRSEGPRPLGPGAPADTLDDYAADRERLVRPGTFLLARGWRQDGEDGLPAAAMSANVGGMGAHWTAACPRPGESERIPFVDGLDELLDEAERLLEVSPKVLADAPLADVVRARLGAALDEGRAPGREVQPMPLAVRRTADSRILWSGADVVFGDVTRANPRCGLYPDSPVTKVLTRDDAVTGVRVRDRRTGEEHDVEARHVVVAADSLRTPQLLYASGIRPRALGRYLNDQPQVVLAVRLRDPGPAPADTPGGPITAQSGVSWVPFTDAEPFHGQVMQLDASPVPVEGDDPVPGSIVGLGWFCAKDISESDRLEFDESEVDENGLPAIRVRYRLTERDHENIERARAAIRRAAQALGDVLDPEPLVFPPGASLHYQGTVRMGERDDGRSVCAPDSQVWGVRGLRVAGNGVIPTATACNPTLTSVALAVAGARAIAHDLEEKPCSNAN
ncbi:Choline dehydrogenase [Amycolatopsis sacchari]|uniref:Choline dehydrogenase n=1 Tax=Amycolatopsis sacchari TaxID=115433 RepID=A0A1I3UQ05_9PSEU|nr:GMC oxidoreductase [Amycolatopsis sacchari]SFJ84086.1 Choline dehydrogenase [Amycolatopsis sacchari]